MESVTSKIIREDNPEAFEYLDYAKRIFEALPEEITQNWTQVPVSCHHLAAITKRRFSDLIWYSGEFATDKVLPKRDTADLVSMGYLGRKGFSTPHSWLGTPDYSVLLDPYPIWHASWPILLGGWAYIPANYGTPVSYLELRTQAFQDQVDILLWILQEKWIE